MSALEISRDGNRVTVVGGIKTMADRDRLSDAIGQACSDSDRTADEIVLDVTRCAYLDASAIGVLVTVARRCVDAGRTLVLEHANDELVEQLRRTKLDQVLGRHGARITAADVIEKQPVKLIDPRAL